MVSVSTSTRLDVLNRALRFVGERPFSITEPLVNNKIVALDCLNQALFVLEHSFDWRFAQRYTNADSWVLERAILPQFTKLHGADYVNAQNYMMPLTPTNAEDLRLRAPFLVSLSSGYQWILFAQEDNETVIVSPYPDVADQDRIFFNYSAALKRPTTDTDTFDIPEDFIPLLVTQLCAQLALNMLNSQADFQNYAAVYERDMRLAISRSQMLSPSQNNMYRRGTYGTRLRF